MAGIVGQFQRVVERRQIADIGSQAKPVIAFEYWEIGGGVRFDRNEESRLVSENFLRVPKNSRILKIELNWNRPLTRRDDNSQAQPMELALRRTYESGYTDPLWFVVTRQDFDSTLTQEYSAGRRDLSLAPGGRTIPPFPVDTPLLFNTALEQDFVFSLRPGAACQETFTDANPFRASVYITYMNI